MTLINLIRCSRGWNIPLENYNLSSQHVVYNKIIPRYVRIMARPMTYHIYQVKNRLDSIMHTTSNLIHAPHKSSQIEIGSRVQINQNANTWATGKSIPGWIPGQVYRVEQMRENNTQLLLAGIRSWIRISDVTFKK